MGKNFLNALEKTMARRTLKTPNRLEKNSFKVNYEKLNPALLPVAKLLEPLVNAKATMLSGDPFQVKASGAGAGESLRIRITNYDFIYISVAKAPETYLVSLPQVGQHLAFGLANLEGILVTELSKYLGTLGYLDKSIYTPKSQDIIGIE
jgi:hypothetical protein